MCCYFTGRFGANEIKSGGERLPPLLVKKKVEHTSMYGCIITDKLMAFPVNAPFFYETGLFNFHL
jgi:hypothetical protein